MWGRQLKIFYHLKTSKTNGFRILLHFDDKQKGIICQSLSGLNDEKVRKAKTLLGTCMMVTGFCRILLIVPTTSNK